MFEEKDVFEDYENRLLDLATKAENGNFDFSHLNPLEILKDVFGHNEFKPQQFEIIKRILNKQGDTLGIMPTGGGKSLCFHIPSLIQKNLTVVVSPLIALMKDQIDNLNKKDIHTAFFVNSSISLKIRERILELVEKKKVKLLYLAPESLKSERILEVLKKVDIDLFVIDEAHCISTWGHNFRPDYLRLTKIIELLNHPQILALTATATKEVEEDIQKQLKIKCEVFKASFDRPNLYIDVISLEENIKKELFLVQLLKKLKGSSIVFVSYRKTSEKVSEILNSHGLKSVYYHAGLDRENREKIQNEFISGKCRIIVATIAFGMGIDKADIRNIIHYNIPQSIENYYQEIGRAGRDGGISNCIFLFTKSDESKIKDLISSSWPDKEKIKNVISYLKNQNTKYFFTTARKINYDCDIKQIPTNLILHRCEEAQAIRIYSNVIYQGKLLYINNHSKIIEENPKYKKDLEKIFSCEFFKNQKMTWLVLEELMNETGLNYFRILEIINHLKNVGCLNFSNTTRKDLILIKDELKNFNIAPLVNLFDDLLSHDLNKVNLLINSLTKQGCIRKNILAYFDEPNLKDRCEMCSYCVGDKFAENIKPEINENYATEEDIAKIINLNIDINNLALVLLLSVAQNKEMPEKDFVKILLGNLTRSYAKWKFDLDCYGILEKFKNQEVVLEEIQKGLIDKGLLSEEIDGVLRITKAGVNYILQNQSILENLDKDRKHSV
jgi:ATP-dependent DNA helicase RecQ